MIFKWMIGIIIGTCAFVSSEIQTQYGPIEGKTMTLFNCKTVDAFLGVPYAAPPVGPYRFASPQPPKSWHETLETKTLSKSCFQSIKRELKPLYWFGALVPESEDCLYLNVWRPSNKKNVDLPVMVWIHGGGYTTGSASMPLYDGSILASENDVIVVSMNYRLDFFGFFYLNSTDVGENVGLQDQIQAIKWVKENIRNFGGDPARVTLFGESAGSFSVGWHLVNPQLSDLFQNVIMESGSQESAVASLVPGDAYNRSRALAESVGCWGDDLQETITCMRSRSAESLLKGGGILYDFVQISLRPVRNGVEVPLDIKATARRISPSERKNIMIGTAPTEAAYLITCFFPQEQITADINITEADLRSTLSGLIQLDDSRLQSVVLHQYKNFDVGQCDRDQLKKEAADLLGDVIFTCPSISFIKSYAAGSNQAYYYYFDHMPSRPIRNPIPDWMGVVHGDDIPFVFGAPLNPQNRYSDNDMKLSKEIMILWSNFAKTGNPNYDNEKIVWPAVEANGTFTYMVLDTPTRLGTNLKARDCDFWETIYPQLKSLQVQLQGTLPTEP